MRGTRKRALSMLLALCMTLCLLPVGATAAGLESRDLTFELAMASDLKGLGLFEGVGTNADGSTNFDLRRAPSRLEALVMLLRLLGKGAEAKAYTGACPFNDVPDWGKPYVAYAYDNGLTNGSSKTQFGMGNASCATYLTFVLRALGYSDAGGADFTWDNPFALAESVKIMPEGVDTKEFWRADVVAVSYAALYAVKKGGTQTLSESLMTQGVFTTAQFEENTDERLLLAHTIPEIRVVGDWPCSENFLKEKWAELYPYYCQYLGLPTKILTEGITWEWDDSITPGTVGYYAETNTFKMGPLPQHDNLNPENHYDYEPLIMQCLHESAHLFWQVGDRNLDFSFGQWAWEASALVAESLYYADKYGDLDHSSGRRFDAVENCGWDAVNGVQSDGNKYNRTIVDGDATNAFIYLASALSDAGTYNYFQKVNDLRLKYYEETGVMSVSIDEYCAMLDEAAGGRTIDGQKPSIWFRSLAVANTDGALGDYLIIYPMRVIDDRAAVLFSCWNRFTDEHGDKREKGYAGQSVSMKVYAPNGKLVGTGSAQTNGVGEGGIDIMELSGISDVTALKTTAETKVNGKALTSTTYTVFSERGIGRTEGNQMYLILLDGDGNIVTDIKAADVKVTGAKSVDTSSLSGGVLVLTVATGGTANISIGGSTFTLSQPIGVRVVPVILK